MILQKNKKLISIPFLIFCLTVYFNNETLSNNLCTFVEQPCQYVAMVGMLYSFIMIALNKAKIENMVILSILVLCASVFLASFFDDRFSNGYFLTIMNIVFAGMLSSIIDFAKFKKYFVKIILFLSISSLLFTYVIRPFLVFLPFTHVLNSSNVPFTNAIVCYVIDFEGYMRNTGIFREAGVWGAFVLIAIMFMFLDRADYSKKSFNYYVIIFVLTLFSTFSIACLVAFGIYILVAYINRLLNYKKDKYLVFLIAGILLLSLQNSSFRDLYNESLDKLSTTSSSYYSRTAVYTNVPTLFFDNMLGHGIVNGARGLMLGLDEENYHNTSTIITSLIYFGVFFFIIYFIGILKFCKCKLDSFLCFIPIMILLNAEQYIFNPIIYMIVFYGIKKRSSK